MRVLCVAEKHSSAKSLADILSGGRAQSQPALDQYTRNFTFPYTLNGRGVSVVMTSVRGHLYSHDFPPSYRSWQSCQPSALFEAPLRTFVTPGLEKVAQNLKNLARASDELIIWTDCDREGEMIGKEVEMACREGNHRIITKRARFSAIVPAQIHTAMRSPVALDHLAASAVEARIELDLRLGAAFTRLQTLRLQKEFAELNKAVVSWGPCQFPTLSFVVQRYVDAITFLPEAFWYLSLYHRKDGIDVTFKWDRGHIFEEADVRRRLVACRGQMCRIEDVKRKEVSKFKPYPLTTVELQKSASRLLRLSPKRILDVAEKLYQGGILSYPRTETDQYDASFDFLGLIRKQCGDASWGNFARSLLGVGSSAEPTDANAEEGPIVVQAGGTFSRPRNGKKNDHAHPPIHPTRHASNLSGDEKRVYEYVTRRFLAGCHLDAKGLQTSVALELGTEGFSASGLQILARNYLDVFTYDTWSTSILPAYTIGQTFPSALPDADLSIKEGATTAPKLLTQADLVALMDRNGIGTDATIAEHIEKVCERGYVFETTSSEDAEGGSDGRSGRGRGRGRGRARAIARGSARARGRGASNAASRSGDPNGGRVTYLVPSTLGMGLVLGYDAIRYPATTGSASGASTSDMPNPTGTGGLCGPQLRRETEARLLRITTGQSTKSEILQESLAQYREMFIISTRELGTVVASVRKYLRGVEQGDENATTEEIAGGGPDDQPAGPAPDQSRAPNTNQNLSPVRSRSVTGNRSEPDVTHAPEDRRSYLPSSSTGSAARHANLPAPVRTGFNPETAIVFDDDDSDDDIFHDVSEPSRASADTSSRASRHGRTRLAIQANGHVQAVAAPRSTERLSNGVKRLGSSAGEPSIAPPRRIAFQDELDGFQPVDDDEFEMLDEQAMLQALVENDDAHRHPSPVRPFDDQAVNRRDGRLEGLDPRNGPNGPEALQASVVDRRLDKTTTALASKVAPGNVQRGDRRPEVTAPDLSDRSFPSASSSRSMNASTSTFASAASSRTSAASFETPHCRCCRPSVTRTVNKTGANQGRQFYACSAPKEEGGCGFFAWTDADGGTGAFGSNAANLSPNAQIRHLRRLAEPPKEQTPAVRCRCDLDAKVCQVNKEGPNKGRHFYTCSKESTISRCGFFEWLPEDGAISGSLGITSGSSGECFLCQQKGHWASECPIGNNSRRSASSKSRNRQGGSSATQACFNCGQEGHWASECPSESETALRNSGSRFARDPPRDSSGTCFRCDQPGHWANTCPQQEAAAWDVQPVAGDRNAPLPRKKRKS
ncbi:prokaryotic type i dna topoisomerase [Ceraceosorus bombacis]|uniref:DNA topoisomerase n=1 Tax=Ceraceosorus bombacis TaxID=401625 RepID=A0A0P1BRJ9_9BASI|nr:prokaryotic type i dna topoisomerase [Ceraceosorus bombacis]